MSPGDPFVGAGGIPDRPGLGGPVRLCRQPIIASSTEVRTMEERNTNINIH